MIKLKRGDAIKCKGAEELLYGECYVVSYRDEKKQRFMLVKSEGLSTTTTSFGKDKNRVEGYYIFSDNGVDWEIKFGTPYVTKRYVRPATELEKRWLEESIVAGHTTEYPTLGPVELVVDKIKKEIYGVPGI